MHLLLQWSKLMLSHSGFVMLTFWKCPASGTTLPAWSLKLPVKSTFASTHSSMSAWTATPPHTQVSKQQALPPEYEDHWEYSDKYSSSVLSLVLAMPTESVYKQWCVGKTGDLPHSFLAFPMAREFPAQPHSSSSKVSCWHTWDNQADTD